MATYVTLFQWTEQGVKNIKDSPARLEASNKLIEAMGGKLVSIYVTMGSYDLVAITEGSSDEMASAAALSIASRGNVKTMTMRAFSPAEFAEIVKKMQ